MTVKTVVKIRVALNFNLYKNLIWTFDMLSCIRMFLLSTHFAIVRDRYLSALARSRNITLFSVTSGPLD